MIFRGDQPLLKMQEDGCPERHMGEKGAGASKRVPRGSGIRGRVQGRQEGAIVRGDESGASMHQ